MSRNNTPTLADAGRLAQHALEVGDLSGRVWTTQGDVHGRVNMQLSTKTRDYSRRAFDARKTDATQDSPLEDLLKNDELKKLYQTEYATRLPNYEILQTGRSGAREVRRTHTYIAYLDAEYQMLSMKSSKDQSDRDAMGEITRLRGEAEAEIGSILAVDQAKGGLLTQKETALYSHLRTLSDYRREYSEKYYISTPSREEYMRDILAAIGSSQSVLLSGDTGTGKTLLAKEAIRATLRSRVVGLPYDEKLLELDGVKLGESLKDQKFSLAVSGMLDACHEYLVKNPKATYQKFLEYYQSHVDTVSGHAAMSPREMTGGSAIRAVADGKGGKTMDTVMILGPLLRAFVEGKPILIDEIDMIPTDTLMRIKVLLTSKPGETYRPQEDTGSEVLLRGIQIIATRNGSGERYGREPLDPAIMRLFSEKPTVGYPPVHEQYEMIVARLMERTGTIATATQAEISSQDGILRRFLDSVEEIRTKFVAWELAKSADRKGLLRSDVIDPGIINGWIDGYLARIGKMALTEYLKGQCLSWLLSIEHSESRDTVAKIFSSKGLISSADMPTIGESYYGKGRVLDSQTQTSLDALTTSWFAGTSGIPLPSDHETRFVDPYEIASLDPWGVYDFESKISSDSMKPFTSLIQEIGRVSQGDSAAKEVCKSLLTSHKDQKTITITPEQVTTLVDAFLGAKGSDVPDANIAILRKLEKISEIQTQMTEAQKTQISELQSKTPTKNTVKTSPNTSNFQSEHMQYSASKLEEAKVKYASDPAKIAILGRMTLIEYTATSWPAHIASQGAWDRVRGRYTHDKSALPEYISSIEYTGADNIRKSFCLLTTCFPDTGTPSNQADVVYVKNHTQENGKKTSYMSYEFAKQNVQGLPSKDDWAAFGFTESNKDKEWNQDLMAILGYYGEDTRLTKWSDNQGTYKYGSTQSAFWSSSPDGSSDVWVAYAGPGGAGLGHVGRSSGSPSLEHL